MLWGDAEPQQQQHLMMQQHHLVLQPPHQLPQSHHRQSRVSGVVGGGFSSDSSSCRAQHGRRRHSQCHRRQRGVVVNSVVHAAHHTAAPETTTAASAPPSPGQRRTAFAAAATASEATSPPSLGIVNNNKIQPLPVKPIAEFPGLNRRVRSCSDGWPEEAQHTGIPMQRQQTQQLKPNNESHHHQQHKRRHHRRVREHPPSPRTQSGYNGPEANNNSLRSRDQQHMSAPHLGSLVASTLPSQQQQPQHHVGHWKPQKIDDGLIEVVAFKSLFHLGQVQVGLAKALRLCQGRSVCLHVSGSLPLQVDGEPQLLEGNCRISISHK